MTIPVEFPAMRARQGGVPSTGFFWLSAALLAMVAVFWSGFVSLGDAWSVPEYSHGPVIPVLSFYLFLHEARRLPAAQDAARRWPGVLTAGLGLVLGLFGAVIGIPDIVTYGFILWTGGVILTVFGWARGVLLWGGVVHLVFMLPLPQFVYWPFSLWLQTVSSEIGVWLIALMGVPVYLDGHVIDLGTYKLQVAEACSGLRYLFPILSFSYVFGMLYTGPLWHKLVLFAAAAPVTVAMNALRIGVIGLMVDRYGPEHAEGFLHLFEGWVVFLLCIAVLFALAWALQRSSRDPRPLGETLDIRTGGLGRQMAQVLTIRATPALTAVTAATVMAAALLHAVPERERVVPERDPLVLFPAALGAWQGVGQRIEPEIERVLGADDYHTAAYTAPGEAAPVDLFIAYYHRQTGGSGIHSPEVCLPAGGWEVSEWAPAGVSVGIGDGALNAARAVIQRGLERQLVYYWFEQRGRRTSSDYAAKAYTVWDALSAGRTDGALVRLVTPIRPGEAEADAAARLERFLPPLLERLPRFVPD